MALFNNERKSSPILFHGFLDLELFNQVDEADQIMEGNHSLKEHNSNAATNVIGIHENDDTSMTQGGRTNTKIKQEMRENNEVDQSSMEKDVPSMVQIPWCSPLKTESDELHESKKGVLDAKEEPKETSKAVADAKEDEQPVQIKKTRWVRNKKEPNEKRSLSPQFCICRGPEEGRMIGCDYCEEWYHADCLNLTKAQVSKLAKEKWACQKCDTKRASSVVSTPVKKENSDSARLLKQSRYEKAFEDLKNNAQDIRCQRCDYEAWDLSDLTTHISENHKESKTISCKECEFKSSEKNILRHVESVHKKNPFIYSWCYIPILSDQKLS